MNFCFARMIQCLLLLFCGKHVSLYSSQNCGHFVDQVKNDDLSRVNSAHERLSESFTTLARVSGRVVVVVVVGRELFSVVTSAICVRIRGQGLRRLFTT